MQGHVSNRWTQCNVDVRFGQEVRVRQVELRFLPLEHSEGVAESQTVKLYTECSTATVKLHSVPHYLKNTVMK